MLTPTRLKIYPVTTLDIGHVIGFIRPDGSTFYVPPKYTPSTPLAELPYRIQYQDSKVPKVYGGDKEAVVFIKGAPTLYQVDGVYSFFVKPQNKDILPMRIWMLDLHYEHYHVKGGTLSHIAMFGDDAWHRLLNVHKQTEGSLEHVKFYNPTITNGADDMEFIKTGENSYDIAIECLGSRREYKTFTTKKGPTNWVIIEWESVLDKNIHYYTISDLMIRKDDNNPILGEDGVIERGEFLEYMRKLNMIE